ncbi:WD_0033/WD_0034 family tandem repeat-containing protein [Wolbachia endosymbiont of Bemisia tabaci]|uniref:WD_0033/WD_0034 family tandem repeat-containing protein n=1 Tax=Wolbachia endosymbiont of Bemisia tabaci TaxID=215173 RepID=UPI000D55B40E|nr:hypothetical protein [Wolbachia endosymbiont of Bemisia tabaci]
MPKFKKIKNKKNIIYKLAGDQDNFTNEDKKKLFKLLKKIENGESISEKFNKSNYNTQKLLTKKIIYKDEEKEGTLTLLCQSMFYKNNQAFEELLQETINQGILQDVLSEELIQKLPNGLTITYTALVSCILEEDSKAIRAVLEASKKNGILKEILNQKVKVKKAEGQEINYTLIDYTNKQNCKEIAFILKEFEEVLNIEVEAASSNVETRCEGINKDCRDLEIHETMFANSEETQNISTGSKDLKPTCETSVKEENKDEENSLNFITDEQEEIVNIFEKDAENNTEWHRENHHTNQPICKINKKDQNTFTQTNMQEPNRSFQAEPYFHIRSSITKDKKSSNQPILAGVIGAVLLV